MQNTTDEQRPAAAHLITDQHSLDLLVERLSLESVLAFDLEADSLHHYTEKVCLIQVSSESETRLIDPLASLDVRALSPIFANPAIKKIFHGADYDMRSLYRDFGIEVVNLFDTMIASQFLGESEFGLAALLKKRFYEIVEGHAAAYNVTARIDYDWGYPATVNTPDEAAFATEVAAEISGPDAAHGHANREMGSEDFSYMLEARPGAYLFMGTGPGAGLHHAAFDFNDEAAPVGASFFARLVEKAQPLA